MAISNPQCHYLKAVPSNRTARLELQSLRSLIVSCSSEKQICNMPITDLRGLFYLRRLPNFPMKFDISLISCFVSTTDFNELKKHFFLKFFLIYIIIECLVCYKVFEWDRNIYILNIYYKVWSTRRRCSNDNFKFKCSLL